MNTTDMLKKEFRYYLDNQNELVKRYNGRVLVVVGENVVGDYDSDDEVYFASEKKYRPGTFLIQRCTPGDEAYTERFHSRVRFYDTDFVETIKSQEALPGVTIKASDIWE